MKRAALCATALLLSSALQLGCGGDDRQSDSPPALSAPVQLVQAESWLLAPPEADPFAQLEPGRVRCTEAAIQPEAGWIEVSTLSCNYATLAYTFEAATRAGNRIQGEIAWSTLVAIDPAVATLAFALGERELWSHEVPIPGQANLVSVEFALPHQVNAGDTLYFHVRNHGNNSWQLSPLTLAPPRPLQ